MNIKQFESNLDNVKSQSPEVYKDTMKLSVPFFILHKMLYSQGDRLLKEQYELNQSELDILASLYYMSDGRYTLSPTQLYEVMLFSSGGMTKVLKKLEEKELITRVENPSDKRSKLVKLSQKGKALTKNALKNVVSLENTYFSKLSHEEQEQFQSLLMKIIN